MIKKNFNFLFFVLTYLFIPVLLFSQIDTGWVRRYNGPGDTTDEATALAVDGNGNVYVTGWSYSLVTDSDYATLKYDARGNLLWERRYNGPASMGDYATALAVDANGNVYVTGGTRSWDTYIDYATLKYDAQGNLLWERRYNGPGNGYDIARAIAVDANGNVYVTGQSDGSGTSSDYLILKYDSNGNLLWERRYNGPASMGDYATALAVDRNGNVYVTGKSYGSGTSYDYATLKYDPNGNLLWERRYNGPRDSADVASALAVDTNGNVYVTGYSYGSGNNYDYVTLKYDANGNLLWERRYNGPVNGDDRATALAVDANGNVYVTGRSQGSGTSSDYLTLKYDSNGNLLWEKRYNGSGNGNDYATALAVDVNGNVYVTGCSQGSGTYFDYVTLKYNAHSNLLWERRYNGPGNYEDYTTALAIDGNGNVYVTGWSYSNSVTSYDYATLKYDASGNLLWEKRYNGSGNRDDRATALAVDGNGNVYVTGESYGSGTNYDYATIKYIQEGASISEEKLTRTEKKPTTKLNQIYDITGKLVKERKLKKGIYFNKTEKEFKKILILK